MIVFPSALPIRTKLSLFILDRLGEAPCIGFDAGRRHWWIRATSDAAVETRLWVARTLRSACESEDAMDIV